jgi:hypothetical protein
MVFVDYVQHLLRLRASAHAASAQPVPAEMKNETAAD